MKWYGVIPEQYTKYQVYNFAAPFGEIEITLAVDDSEAYYIIFFTAFGDQQTLTGTLTPDHVATNKYDRTGFFATDVQSFINGADWDAWTAVE